MLGIIILGVLIGLVAALVSAVAGGSLWAAFIVYVAAGNAAILLYVVFDLVAAQFRADAPPDAPPDAPTDPNAPPAGPATDSAPGAWPEKWGVAARMRDPGDE